jgi:hypothetical protein
MDKNVQVTKTIRIVLGHATILSHEDYSTSWNLRRYVTALEKSPIH